MTITATVPCKVLGPITAISQTLHHETQNLGGTEQFWHMPPPNHGFTTSGARFLSMTGRSHVAPSQSLAGALSMEDSAVNHARSCSTSGCCKPVSAREPPPQGVDVVAGPQAPAVQAPAGHNVPSRPSTASGTVVARPRKQHV